MHRFPEPLLQGYRSFMDNRYSRERFRELAAGQSPIALVIACCDSRSAPEVIFDSGPGELFVLRNVANLVPPFQPDSGQHGTSAAIEFAVQQLKIANIVVMGHGRCGGIRAALATDSVPLAQGDFIGKWMGMITEVSEQVAGYTFLTQTERETALERLSVRNSIKNLRTFPYIQSREAEGKLTLHGAWFDVSTAELWLMDPEAGDFVRPELPD
jgi:carbonic anhydrase